MSAAIATVHVAGDYVRFVQRCCRCGCVLIDNTGAAFLAKDGPPRGWSPGAAIACGDAGDWLLGRADCVTLDANEQWCLESLAI